MKWARHHPDGYEVTSRGDKRFSPLFAKLKDGRLIEDAYQLDVKGYRALGYTRWQDVKGEPPVRNLTRQQCFDEFLALYRTWAAENPELILELQSLTKGKVLVDRFATSYLNQAHALSIILTELEFDQATPFTF